MTNASDPKNPVNPARENDDMTDKNETTVTPDTTDTADTANSAVEAKAEAHAEAAPDTVNATAEAEQAHDTEKADTAETSDSLNDAEADAVLQALDNDDDENAAIDYAVSYDDDALDLGDLDITIASTDDGRPLDGLTQDMAFEHEDAPANTDGDDNDAAASAHESSVESVNAQHVAETLNLAQDAMQQQPKATSASRTEAPAMAVSSRLDRKMNDRNAAAAATVFGAYPVFAFDHVTLVDKKSGRRVIDDLSFQCHVTNAYAILVNDDDTEFRTSLLALMAGMRVPTSGAVMSKSKNFVEIEPLELRGHRLSLIMQQFMFRADLDAEQNMLYAMDASNRTFLKPKPVLARELLASTGFSAATSGVKAADLDVIDQRRLTVARALAGEPDVIIADEPTAELNHDDAVEILQLITSQVRGDKKRAVIIVTSSQMVANEVGNIIDLRDE